MRFISWRKIAPFSCLVVRSTVRLCHPEAGEARRGGPHSCKWTVLNNNNPWIAEERSLRVSARRDDKTERACRSMSPDRSLTRSCANDTPFRHDEPRGEQQVDYGPWLVALGAALVGNGERVRVPLNELFDAPVIVFWEHVLIILMFLPLLDFAPWRNTEGVGSSLGISSFSRDLPGSAVGAVFLPLALKNGNPTVVNVIL